LNILRLLEIDQRARYVQAQRRNESASIQSLSPTTSSSFDQLGPSAIIEQIIHDWFELVHSVCPILHRASFLKRLTDGDVARDSGFSALVTSVCAAAIGSLKRKSATYYGIITVQRCLRIIEQIGFGRVNQKFSLEWCQTKYNLAVAISSEVGMDDADSFRFMGEAVTGVKYLVYYELENMTFLSQQLLKRLYWLLFAAQW
jgi:hypothetical protein